MALFSSFPAEGKRFKIILGKAFQILLSTCGLLLCLSYGLMFGWPCHYFAATFRDPDARIDIPFETAPLLAGTLMMGNIGGTILSYFSRPNSKYTMVVGGATMALGWSVLWQSQTIDWFFASRFFIGLGLGLTNFNLSNYIQEICDAKLSRILTKFKTIFIYVGIFLSTIIAYVGADIPSYGLYVAIMTLVNVVGCIVIPQPPGMLYRFGDIKQARRLKNSLNPNGSLDEDLAILEKKENDLRDCNIIWTDLLTKSKLRCKFLVLFVSCFLQQFTGMPATIVFGEFIYEKFEVPNPNRVTIFYMMILIVVYSVSTFTINNNKKCFVMLSGGLICMDFIILINLYHYNITANHPIIVIVLMYLYIVFHTFGLGSLTGQVCIEMFPKCYNRVVTHFLVMFNAMFAIIVGKTFQILFDHFNLYGPFIMYAILSGVSVPFIWLFIRKYDENERVVRENENKDTNGKTT